MNVEINFSILDMGLSLCAVCNLGSFRGRFRRVFGSMFVLLYRDKQHRERRTATAVNSHNSKSFNVLLLRFPTPPPPSPQIPSPPSLPAVCT